MGDKGLELKVRSSIGIDSDHEIQPTTVEQVLRNAKSESFFQNPGLVKLYAVLIPGVLFCIFHILHGRNWINRLI